MTNDRHGSAEEDTASGQESEEHPEEISAETPDHRARLSIVSCFAIGLVAAVIGLVPWLFTGMRLPLQNLWATPVPPESMPVGLLPLSQYSTTLVAGLVVTGSAIAGLVLRATRSRLERAGALSMILGVLVVHVSAGVQALVVISDGLEDSTRGRLYLAALIVVVSLAIALGILVLALIGRAAVPGATIAMCAAALAAGIWVNALVAPFGAMPTETTGALIGLTRWVPAILAGAALGWCGIRTVGRMVAVLGGLLVLWLGAAAITAVSAAAGTRILAAYPLEMLDYGAGVFRMAMGIPELALPPILVALGIAVAWWVVRWFQARRSAGVVTDG